VRATSRLCRAVALSWAVLCLTCCSGRDHASAIAQAPSPIRHVVLIVQENRSFDNLFHGFPGADTADYGYDHAGTKIPLRPVSLAVDYDLNHGYRAFLTAYDTAGWTASTSCTPERVCATESIRSVLGGNVGIGSHLGFQWDGNRRGRKQEKARNDGLFRLLEMRRLELLTSNLQSWRSTN
jgi:hypothetical protein